MGKWLPTISHHNNKERKGDKNYYEDGKNDATIIKMINDNDDADGDDSDDADKEIMGLGRP